MPNLFRIFTLLAISLLFIGKESLFAQLKGQPKIDSLISLLPKQKEDTNKVDMLLQISEEYSDSKPDSGLSYGRQSMQLAQKLKWKHGIANSYNYIGANYFRKAKLDSAVVSFTEAARIFEEINEIGMLCSAKFNIASFYLMRGEYDKSLDNFLETLQLAEKQVIHYYPALVCLA